MHQQIPLFDIEENQPQQKPSPASGPLRCLIQRGLDQLKQHDNWIQRTSDLKFKRLEDRTDE